MSKARLTPETVIPQVRKLRSPAERERTQTYYIEGARIVSHALEAGAPLTLGILAPDLLRGQHAHDTANALRAADIPVVEMSRAAFESISFKENLSGIGAVVAMRRENVTDIHPKPTDLWVALDNVGNAGNLGAIMRTCDAVGTAGLIMIGSTTDPHHPDTIRASMGSFFALRLARAESFEAFATWKSEHPLIVVGTTPDVSQEYRAVHYPSGCILLMGSERTGLSAAQQAVCDLLVRIPMTGTVDSLNLGVATSIVLYEMYHQRRERAETA